MPDPRSLSPTISRDAHANFSTTRWNLVFDAKNAASPDAVSALDELCRDYWPPLFAYLRRQGLSSHDAEDLVQTFFARLVARDFLQGVGPEKGKFRSFMLAALRNFLANHRRANSTQRRGGEYPCLNVGFSEIEDQSVAEIGEDSSAETAFDREWAVTVFERARRSLEREQNEANRGEQFEVVRSWLFDEPGEGEFAAISERLGMSRSYVSVLVHRIRKRFRALLRKEILQTVNSPEDLEAEYSYLLDILTRR